MNAGFKRQRAEWDGDEAMEDGRAKHARVEGTVAELPRTLQLQLESSSWRAPLGLESPAADAFAHLTLSSPLSAPSPTPWGATPPIPIPLTGLAPPSMFGPSFASYSPGPILGPGGAGYSFAGSAAASIAQYGPPPLSASSPMQSGPSAGDAGPAAASARWPAAASAQPVLPVYPVLSLWCVSIKCDFSNAPSAVATTSYAAASAGPSVLLLSCVLDAATNYALHVGVHRWSDAIAAARSSNPAIVSQWVVHTAVHAAVDTAIDLLFTVKPPPQPLPTDPHPMLTRDIIRSAARAVVQPARIQIGDTPAIQRVWAHVKDALALPLQLTGASAAAAAAQRARLAAHGDFKWGCGNAEPSSEDDDHDPFAIGAATSTPVPLTHHRLSARGAGGGETHPPVRSVAIDASREVFPHIPGYPSTTTISYNAAAAPALGYGQLPPASIVAGVVLGPLPSLAGNAPASRMLAPMYSHASGEGAASTMPAPVPLPFGAGVSIPSAGVAPSMAAAPHPSPPPVLPPRALKQACDLWNVRADAPCHSGDGTSGYGSMTPADAGGSPGIRLLTWFAALPPLRSPYTAPPATSSAKLMQAHSLGSMSADEQ